MWYQKVRPGEQPGLLVRGSCGPGPPGRAIPDRVASWASPLVWHWWGGCPQPLGPPGLMCAPSVERGGGGNGWADGLTGGALRAAPEPPTKISGEICCLEQYRPDAESLGPFGSGVGQRCRGGPQSNGKHALHQQGLPPGVDCGGGRGYRRCWADPMAGLANASTWVPPAGADMGGGAAVVVSGPDVGDGHPGGWLGAFSGLDIAFVPESGCGVGSVTRGGRRPGPGSK